MKWNDARLVSGDKRLGWFRSGGKLALILSSGNVVACPDSHWKRTNNDVHDFELALFNQHNTDGWLYYSDLKRHREGVA